MALAGGPKTKAPASPRIWRFGARKEGPITHNRVRCRLCGTVLESTDADCLREHVCTCGATAINGGTRWLGRGWGVAGPQYEELVG